MAVRAIVRDRARMTATLDLGLWTRSRIKLVRQTEMAECGLACLAMIARYHGLNIDLGSLRRRFPPSVRGASLKSLIALRSDRPLDASGQTIAR